MPNPITRLPELWIWPHAGCNHRCVSCDIWQDRSRRELSAEEVLRWADEWPALGVEEVVFTGGEALMHRDLFSIAEPLRARGFTLSLLSTGILLTKHAERIVDCFDAVLVSLDGPPAVHDQVRRVPRAHRMLDAGVAALRRLRPDYPVQARCTVHRFNYRHLSETAATARELGATSLTFIPADVTSEAFNRDGGWDVDRQEDLVVPAEEMDALAEEIDRLVREQADAFADGMVHTSPEHLRTHLLDYYRAFHGRRDYPEVSCDLPWGSAVIEVDGTVRPCFFQPAYGNLREAGGLTELLNSPEAVRWREELDVSTDEICRRCVCARTLGVRS